MSTLERGFKAWAERTSKLIRTELEIGLDDPLEMRILAEYLGVRLWTPHDVPGIQASDLKILLEEHLDDWYGIGLQDRRGGIVIFNPSQSERRQNSDIAHELAHFLLEHEPSKLILSESKVLEQIWLRSYDQKQEDEANCLAWALLVPRDGLVASIRRRLSVSQIADKFRVSEQLTKFRINATGVRRQFKN